MGIFRKVDPTAWVEYVKEVQSLHMQGFRILELWMMGIDSKIKKGNLISAYSPQFPEGLDGNINDFIELQATAKSTQTQGFKVVGTPKYRASGLDAYAVGVINQDVFHEVLLNIFVHKVLEVGAVVHCLQKAIDPELFKPFVDARESLRVFLEAKKFENKQYLDLFFANDIILGKRDTSDQEILRWADQTFGYIRPYRQLAQKRFEEVRSLMPWILGEETSPNLQSLRYED